MHITFKAQHSIIFKTVTISKLVNINKSIIFKIGKVVCNILEFDSALTKGGFMKMSNCIK